MVTLTVTRIAVPHARHHILRYVLTAWPDLAELKPQGEAREGVVVFEREKETA